MAISWHFGTGAQGTAVSKSLLPWAYSSAFRIMTDNGQLARMSDIKAPLDKKTTVKITLDKIANVYSTLADNSVPLACQSANVTGATVFAELKTITTKTLTDGTVIQLPMVGRIELRLPNDADIAESDIESLVLATYAALCDDAGSPVVVTEKIRGALTPAGI